MSNYKQPKRKSSDHIFSFSHSKKGSEALREEQDALTAAEQRGLVGWLGSILQPFGEEFLHAIKNCQRRSIVDLSRYIAYHYPHLKEIVSYYIISLLIDWGFSDWQEDAEDGEKQSAHVFLNIIIEELAARFYRQSQWLTKIMHLPIYQVFSLLDKFSKGYLTIKDLTIVCAQPSLKGVPQELVVKKLKGNLGGLKQRIYQQNLRQLQLRVDLTSFSYPQLQKGQDCSHSYSKIYAVLSKWANKYQQEKLHLEQIQLHNARKQLQEFELNREDYQIKTISKSFLQPSQTPSKEKMLNHYPSLLKERIFDENTPQTKHRTEEKTKVQLEPELTLGESQEQRKQHFFPLNKEPLTEGKLLQVQSSKKAAEKAIKFELQARQKAQQEQLLIKAAILSELQHIKFIKFHNRHHLYSYI